VRARHDAIGEPGRGKRQEGEQAALAALERPARQARVQVGVAGGGERRGQRRIDGSQDEPSGAATSVGAGLPHERLAQLADAALVEVLVVVAAAAEDAEDLLDGQPVEEAQVQGALLVRSQLGECLGERGGVAVAPGRGDELVLDTICVGQTLEMVGDVGGTVARALPLSLDLADGVECVAPSGAAQPAVEVGDLLSAIDGAIGLGESLGRGVANLLEGQLAAEVAVQVAGQRIVDRSDVRSRERGGRSCHQPRSSSFQVAPTRRNCAGLPLSPSRRSSAFGNGTSSSRISASSPSTNTRLTCRRANAYRSSSVRSVSTRSLTPSHVIAPKRAIVRSSRRVPLSVMRSHAALPSPDVMARFQRSKTERISSVDFSFDPPHAASPDAAMAAVTAAVERRIMVSSVTSLCDVRARAAR
jgi:hypothetical protein